MKRVQAVLTGAFAFALSVLCIVPFAYVLLRSFWTDGGITFQSYYDVFLGSPQYLFRFWKSLALAVCIAFGQLFISILAGYGFAKYKFPGRNALFFLMMILMTLPVQVMLIPNYLMLSYMDLLDTYAALVLPSVFIPIGAFILTQSFRSISESVIDAAMLDGCGVPRILIWVAVPMNKSGIICVFLLSFLDAWNMVEQPIAYLKDFEQYPLSVALAYVPPADTTAHLVCCMLVILPALFLFTLFNKELVEGIVLAEVK